MKYPFGLVPLRGEGKPVHPDDVYHGMSAEATDYDYYVQLKRYAEAYPTSVSDTCCSRPRILDRIKEEMNIE